MEANKILNADYLDLLFEGRNKEYGAYNLRKTYNKRITIAIAAMLALCLFLFLANVLANRKTDDKQGPMIVQDVNLENVKQEEKKPEPPPPPPPPKVEPPKIEIKQFTPPKIVKDEEVKQPPPKQEELEKTTIGTINQEGVQTDAIAPPVEAKGTGVVEAPKVTEDYDKEFKSVQIQATFPGGQGEWQKYLQRNLKNDTPTENGAPTGSYTVVVSFLVDKSGNISEVRAENDPGYGTASEAVRVITKGPRWNPAQQNGRNVIYRQRQAITFKVEDSQ